MNKYSYGRQKFISAVDSLVGRYDIHDRLYYAVSGLSHLRSEVDIPAELQDAFNNLIEDMTCKPDKVEGSIKKTVYGLSDDEAENAAKVVFDLYNSLLRDF